jgi:hypothetical protein
MVKGDVQGRFRQVSGIVSKKDGSDNGFVGHDCPESGPE